MEQFHKECEGASCELLTLENEFISLGFVQIKEKNILEISLRGRAMAFAKIGQRVKVNAYCTEEHLVVLSGMVEEFTSTHVRILNLRMLDGEEKRRHFRMNVGMRAYISLDGREYDQIAYVSNISLGGISVKCGMPLGMGKYFYLKLRLPTGFREFACQVKRAERLEDGSIQYGCVFGTLSLLSSESLRSFVMEGQKKQGGT